ncbi:MAG: tRNA (N(6)-L-threonylcarbamoyladenosine(37)-C(2))-methylthiotransferase MtaB [Tissierellia bacterium]|nr:tRNA (N(6)-L-threonylcarbamoyladenosine(37)-C(2))-methylthiotransferase MtaB [Tissierellia bacterium]
MHYFSTLTLGCKVNQYETEAMIELFEDRGYTHITDDDFASDVYLINTCTVTNLSDRKSRQFIRAAKRKNPEAIVAVVGCYSQVSPEEVAEIEGVDIIVGTTERAKIVELCEEFSENRTQINIVRDIKGDRDFQPLDITNLEGMTRAYIKIQDGCNQYCSYCIIPYARGNVRSRLREDIIEEVTRLVEVGFKEVVLTGIHVASYGKDLDDYKLIDVIEDIAKIKNIERIRLSSFEPNLITEDFVSRMKGTGKVCDHFHLSLQSGSDRVLKLMNRKYDTEIYKSKIEILRKYFPQAGITTDIIVGFPSETDEDFEDTLKYVRDIEFSKVHVFKYSMRKNTPAAKMKEQIHGTVKNERSKELIELAGEKQFEFNEKMVGRILSVLVEEKVDEMYQGHSTNYVLTKLISETDIVNHIVNIEIVEAFSDYVVGKIVEEDLK